MRSAVFYFICIGCVLTGFSLTETCEIDGTRGGQKGVPREMKLLIASFGTVESQTEVEQWLSDLLRPQKMDNSTPVRHNDGFVGEPDKNCEAITIDWKTRQLRYFKTENEIEKENARRMRVLTDLKMAMLSDKAKRYTQLARDYLQSAIVKQVGGKLIRIVDRGNMTIQQTEKQIKGAEIDNTNGADCVLSVVLGDQEKEEITVPVDMAGTQIRRIIYTAPYVGKIRDLEGNLLYAFNGSVQVRHAVDNVVGRSLSNPSRKLIEKVCENIAKDVVSFFTVNLDFKIKVPPKYDVDDVEIYIDGKDVDNECVRVLSCEHILEARLDGCADIKRIIRIDGGEERKRIRLSFKEQNNKVREIVK